MENPALEKAKAFSIAEIITYVPNAVVVKTIIEKAVGKISMISFDSMEILPEKTAAYDTFIQVIDGKAEVLINDKSNMLETGQSIIIPAYSRSLIKAETRFKALRVVIKSGYERSPDKHRINEYDHQTAQQI